jgi:hypothetical protein
MAENKMRNAIAGQRAQIVSKMREIGLAPPAHMTTSFVSPSMNYSSKINDPDTWTGPLADSQADETKTEINNLWRAFKDFIDELEEAYNQEPPTVADDDIRATWGDSSKEVKEMQS